MQNPSTPTELAAALRTLADAHQPIHLGGNFSKFHVGQLGKLRPIVNRPDENRVEGGSPDPQATPWSPNRGPASGLGADARPGRDSEAAAAETISTSHINRLLSYDPRDLTISVEAGMPFAELQRILAEHRQMLPLDPPWLAQSTVGGVVATNLSGPLRRQYGTARDMIIGMTFATLEGKLVASGGMVVKNVAGLDMAKLMIGSFGTLAAIAVVNFKVFPMPPEWRTFEWTFADVRQAFAQRDRILQSPLQPAAIDIDNLTGEVRLSVRVGGSPTVLDRWSREHPDAQLVKLQNEPNFWAELREFPARFLEQNQQGIVAPLHCKLADMPDLAATLTVPFIARAGSGVIYTFLQNEPNSAPDPPLNIEAKIKDFESTAKIKEMFDPEHLLNRGRLHGRL